MLPETIRSDDCLCSPLCRMINHVSSLMVLLSKSLPANHGAACRLKWMCVCVCVGLNSVVIICIEDFALAAIACF